MTMRVEIWTDIICPWCGLGQRQLDTALEGFAHKDEVEVIHRSFQLDESAKEGETAPVRQMLRKKGMSDAQIDAVTARVETMAKAAGLDPYVVRDNRVGNTSLAHELAAWATEQGRGKEMWDALYVAYFGEARSIFDVDSLVALAKEKGFDEAGAREALTSRRFRDQVKAEGREARQLGSSGVPFVVIDRRYGVSGAQPVEAFAQALERAWESRPAEASKNEGGNEGASCGADSCT